VNPVFVPEILSEDRPPVDPASEAHRVRQAAVDLLAQGHRLLQALSPSVYGQPVPSAFQATIGAHYRHCLDHFVCLLRGVDVGLIDYDRRDRDREVETDPRAALLLTRTLQESLKELTPTQLIGRVTARSAVSYQAGDSPLTQSTVARELAYAIAHGIHHYALISVMARLLGATLPPDFGVAPSTLVHRASVAGEQPTPS
jgi:uncharacterized damage-inducible protein DinB